MFQKYDDTGAGASFPAPIYARWADAYQKATGSRINYQSIGSVGGRKQITAKTVDFGASDMPLKPEGLDKDGLMQFPTVIGVVRRSDGSGTTFLFTNYLSKVSAEWRQKVREGTAVQWPIGFGGKPQGSRSLIT